MTPMNRIRDGLSRSAECLAVRSEGDRNCVFRVDLPVDLLADRAVRRFRAF